MMRPLSRRGKFHVSARALALGSAAALFALLCALPIAWMLGVSFIDSDGGFSIGNYTRLLAGPRERQLMLNSALLGASGECRSVIRTWRRCACKGRLGVF